MTSNYETLIKQAYLRQRRVKVAVLASVGGLLAFITILLIVAQ